MTRPTFHPSDPTVTGLDDDLLEAQRQANAVFAEAPALDPTAPGGLQQLRAISEPPQTPPELTPEDIVIEGPAGDLRLHVFVPPGPLAAVLVYIHGGGHVTNGPGEDEALNDRTARACRVAVVSPDYRLAPESTIQSQVEECVATARWTASESGERFGVERVFLGGLSGGANLAASTLLRLRDRGEPAFERILGVLLDSGHYDISRTPSHRAATDDIPVLPRTLLDGVFEIATGEIEGEARRDPAVSPLYADLAGLPPALFTVGTLDPLLDDSRFMAARWQSAGNRADLDVWPECPHTFSNLSMPLSEPAFERTASWITGALGSPRLSEVIRSS
jgi:acetyl esterase/lipase